MARKSASAERRPGPGELGLAAASGVVLGVAFLPAPLGFLGWFAFVPLLLALDRRLARGARTRSLFALGWSFGFVFFLIGMHWIALLSDVAITVPPLKYLGWVLAAAYLAVFPGLALLAAGWITRQARVPLAAVFPIVFLAVEVLRGSGELGFPWFQPGYTQSDYAPWIQFASLGGVALVTAWLLIANVLAWRAWATRRPAWIVATLLALALPWGWGVLELRHAPRGRGPEIALVQGNIPGEIKWSGHHQDEILATFLQLSQEAVERTPRPTLLVWPETATGSYLRKQVDQLLRVAEFTSRTQVPIFSGFADYEFAPDGTPRSWNAAGLFAPEGSVGEIYAKRHLVPFGERMPFQRLLPVLGKLELGQAEWLAGEKSVRFASAAGPFACLVCFESIFPDLAREDVRRGARWLANVTNDEWFGNSAALYQHAAMARLRAVENHVPVVRCANTGLTEFIDAYGRVERAAPVFRPVVLSGTLALPGPRTLYSTLGDWPGALAGLASVALLLRALIAAALTARARRP